MERVLDRQQADSYRYVFVHLLTSVHAISRLESGVLQAYKHNTTSILYVSVCTAVYTDFVSSFALITVTKGLKFTSQLEVTDNDQRANAMSAILELSFYWLQFIGFFSFRKAKTFENWSLGSDRINFFTDSC